MCSVEGFGRSLNTLGSTAMGAYILNKAPLGWAGRQLAATVPDVVVSVKMQCHSSCGSLSNAVLFLFFMTVELTTSHFDSFFSRVFQGPLHGYRHRL